jgi:hypothetical protein
MPLYEISPPNIGRSYTSPFEDYGLGAEEPAPPSVQKTVTDVVMKDDAETDWMAYLSPVIAGLVLSIMSYGIARGFEIDKGKAAKLAITMGGVTALGHGLSNWLFKHTEPIRQQLPGAAGPIPKGEPAVAQIPPATTK